VAGIIEFDARYRANTNAKPAGKTDSDAESVATITGNDITENDNGA